MKKGIQAKSVSEAVGTILAKICYPAAEEFGKEFFKLVSNWRRANTLDVLKKADVMYREHRIKKTEHAHPRLVHTIVEESSWIEDTLIQDMWAGLLVASCSESGKDDSNLLFVNILRQLSSVQASILRYACDAATTRVSKVGLLYADDLTCDVEKLMQVSGCSDLQRLDRELDHMRSLELIPGGFRLDSTTADITPTSLALHLYTRCQGYRGSPIDFFHITHET